MYNMYRGDKMENLILMRKSKKLTQAQVAEYLKIDKTTFCKYETGKSEPDLKTLKKLAEFFGTTVEYLIGNTDDPSPSKTDATRIPVVGRVEAGIAREAIQDIIDWEEIDPEMLRGGAEYIGLVIHGKSMEPRMKDGDVVIVRIQDDCDTGDIAIVFVNGDEATCKKIKKTPEGVLLIPFNDAFEPMFYTNQEIIDLPVRIFGKVVELRAKF